MKRFYECTFIVNPGLDDAQIESTVKTAEDTIVKNGGEIVNSEHIGRRRLAYPIAKKHNGYYVSVEFTAEGRIVEKVERFLKLDENVMRFLTLTLDDRELEAKRSRTAFVAQDRARGKDGSGNGDRDSKGDAEKKEKADEKKADEKKADEKEADEKKDTDAAKKSESKEEEQEKKETAAEETAGDESAEKSDDSSEQADDSKE